MAKPQKGADLCGAEHHQYVVLCLCAFVCAKKCFVQKNSRPLLGNLGGGGMFTVLPNVRSTKVLW